MRIVRRSAAWGVVIVFASASARARIEFPSVADRAVGIRASTDMLGMQGVSPAWRVDAGDVQLFGIAGLRVEGVRTSARVGSFLTGVSIAQLASPVGSESRAELELGYRAGARWLCRARAGVETVAITGAAGERAVLAGVYSRAEVGRIAAMADVDVVSREHVRDVEVAIALAGQAGPVSIVATSRFDGDAVAAAGIAVVSRVSGRLALVAGYDDGTESIRGAALVSLSSWQLGVGVFQHAVLGVSQGVTLSWWH